MRLRRLFDMLTHRPAPPHDERSIRAVQLREAETETARTLERIDKLVPAPYRRVRSQAVLAQRRLEHR